VTGTWPPPRQNRYRVPHHRRAVTAGNEARAGPSPAPRNRHHDVIDDFPGLTSAITLVWG
jgi:hypothetical protein